MALKLKGRERRKLRIRKKVHGTKDRPRMSVFKSARHISVQVIDDEAGSTVVSASTYEGAKEAKKNFGNCMAAKAIGEAIAERAKSKGIEQVVFDRNGYRYHGRVKVLADAARQKGLKF